jgi:hypothetical protein
MVTGLGSIDVKNLIAAVEELAPTSTFVHVSTPRTTETQTVQVSALVTSIDGAPLAGSVLFYADTTAAEGLADTSLMATATVAPLSVLPGIQLGVATASIVVPPGSFGKAQIVAFYTGDGHALASYSPPAQVTTSSTFSVTPATATIAAGDYVYLEGSGGVQPYGWQDQRDPTCGPAGCGYVFSVAPDLAVYVAGGSPGTAVVEGIDADGASSTAEVTVVAAQ